MPVLTVVTRRQDQLSEELTRAQTTLDWARQEVREWLRLHLSTGHASEALVEQLARHYARHGEFIGSRFYHFHFYGILDAIGWLEGTSRFQPAKKATPFKGALAGLWHQHWFEPQFLYRNLLNEIQNDRFSSALWGRFRKAKANHPSLAGTNDVADLSGLLAHIFTIDAFKQRVGAFSRTAENRLTGEFIIFYPRFGQNYYLGLSSHMEPDQHRYARIRPALEQLGLTEMAHMLDSRIQSSRSARTAVPGRFLPAWRSTFSPHTS